MFWFKKYTNHLMGLRPVSKTKAEVAMKYGWEDVWAGKPIGATRLVKNTTRCTFLGLSLFIG